MPIVITGVVTESLKRHLHVLVAEGETLFECLEDVEVFLGEQI